MEKTMKTRVVVLAAVLACAGWSASAQDPAPENPQKQAAPAAVKKNAPTAGIQWVTIPGGSFMMGSGNGAHEGPVHSVTIKSFQMAKTLVTNKQYSACMKAGPCQNFSDAPEENDDDQPVGVLWDGAKTFSKWVGGRLPSEAEWEYAARSGGKDRKYPWGNEAATCERAVIRGCGDSTASVCSKPNGNTEQGLCDMAGNAWEWMQDWYHDSYKGAPTDGSAWESPASSARVLRGGAWDVDADGVRSAHRNNYAAIAGLSTTTGFRPVR